MMAEDMLSASGTGFAIGFSLIMAIGAQNAFVLRQGLIGAHVFWICLLCAMSDALLISAGVLLAGSISAQAGWAMQWITFAGAGFLIIYGSIAARRAFSPGCLVASERSPQAFASAALTCLALTWLNPHVYLETVGLIGVVSTGFTDAMEKVAFGSGAIAASFVFFFGLGYGARLLAPMFSQPRAWAILDLSIACEKVSSASATAVQRVSRVRATASRSSALSFEKASRSRRAPPPTGPTCRPPPHYHPIPQVRRLSP